MTYSNISPVAPPQTTEFIMCPRCHEMTLSTDSCCSEVFELSADMVQIEEREVFYEITRD